MSGINNYTQIIQNLTDINEKLSETGELSDNDVETLNKTISDICNSEFQDIGDDHLTNFNSLSDSIQKIQEIKEKFTKTIDTPVTEKVSSFISNIWGNESKSDKMDLAQFDKAATKLEDTMRKEMEAYNKTVPSDEDLSETDSDEEVGSVAPPPPPPDEESLSPQDEGLSQLPFFSQESVQEEEPPRKTKKRVEISDTVTTNSGEDLPTNLDDRVMTWESFKHEGVFRRMPGKSIREQLSETTGESNTQMISTKRQHEDEKIKGQFLKKYLSSTPDSRWSNERIKSELSSKISSIISEYSSMTDNQINISREEIKKEIDDRVYVEQKFVFDKLIELTDNSTSVEEVKDELIDYINNNSVIKEDEVNDKTLKLLRESHGDSLEVTKGPDEKGLYEVKITQLDDELKNEVVNTIHRMFDDQEFCSSLNSQLSHVIELKNKLTSFYQPVLQKYADNRQARVKNIIQIKTNLDELRKRNQKISIKDKNKIEDLFLDIDIQVEVITQDIAVLDEKFSSLKDENTFIKIKSELERELAKLETINAKIRPMITRRLGLVTPEE